MKSILALFMAKYLMTRTGMHDPMSENEAEGYTHWFVAGVYYLPVVGALLSDGVLGKYRTILWLSIVYCFGHFALAINDTRFGLAVGLGLICVGAGGIKPCVSANVGDQFGASNKHLLSKVFGWFYFSINAGSFISTILCPFLLEDKRVSGRTGPSGFRAWRWSSPRFPSGWGGASSSTSRPPGWVFCARLRAARGRLCCCGWHRFTCSSLCSGRYGTRAAGWNGPSRPRRWTCICSA